MNFRSKSKNKQVRSLFKQNYLNLICTLIFKIKTYIKITINFILIIIIYVIDDLILLSLFFNKIFDFKFDIFWIYS